MRKKSLTENNKERIQEKYNIKNPVIRGPTKKGENLYVFSAQIQSY